MQNNSNFVAMKGLCIYIILSLVCIAVRGQKIEYPDLKKNASTIEEFVPNGWAIWAVTHGDLNKDKLQDAVIVIQKQDVNFVKTKGSGENEYEYDANPRVLMVLFKNVKGGYTLAAHNNTFILRNSNPDRIDPFQSISINSNGILAIDFHFYYVTQDEDMNNTTYKFRYQNNNIELIGTEIMKVKATTGESIDYSFNFMTKKVCTTKQNILNGLKISEVWESFNMDKLQCIKTLIQPYTWKVNDIDI